jgi:surface protein
MRDLSTNFESFLNNTKEKINLMAFSRYGTDDGTTSGTKRKRENKTTRRRRQLDITLRYNQPTAAHHGTILQTGPNLLPTVLRYASKSNSTHFPKFTLDLWADVVDKSTTVEDDVSPGSGKTNNGNSTTITPPPSTTTTTTTTPTTSILDSEWHRRIGDGTQRANKNNQNAESVPPLPTTCKCNWACTLFYSIVFLALLGFWVDPEQQQQKQIVQHQKCFANGNELRHAVQMYALDPTPNSPIAQKYGWPMGNWCTTHVVRFNRIFKYSPLNEDISNWDTSNAVDMTRMFYGARNFDQDLSKWVRFSWYIRPSLICPYFPLTPPGTTLIFMPLLRHVLHYLCHT